MPLSILGLALSISPIQRPHYRLHSCFFKYSPSYSYFLRKINTLFTFHNLICIVDKAHSFITMKSRNNLYIYCHNLSSNYQNVISKQRQ